jgi:DNA-binding XRE family transcriptional regulator
MNKTHIIERTIDSVIKEKFGNVNSLYESKEFSVTKQHLYRVISGQVSTNITIANELAEALGLELFDVYTLLVRAKEVHDAI